MSRNPINQQTQILLYVPCAVKETKLFPLIYFRCRLMLMVLANGFAIGARLSADGNEGLQNNKKLCSQQLSLLSEHLSCP